MKSFQFGPWEGSASGRVASPLPRGWLKRFPPTGPQAWLFFWEAGWAALLLRHHPGSNPCSCLEALQSQCGAGSVWFSPGNSHIFYGCAQRWSPTPPKVICWMRQREPPQLHPPSNCIAAPCHPFLPPPLEPLIQCAPRLHSTAREVHCGPVAYPSASGIDVRHQDTRGHCSFWPGGCELHCVTFAISTNNN